MLFNYGPTCLTLTGYTGHKAGTQTLNLNPNLRQCKGLSAAVAREPLCNTAVMANISIQPGTNIGHRYK